ncbi:hypothetical protein [Nonomuraea typhae]|uniref:Minor tail protein n=1 Tax=Nonomuraea typhae TaxID=2603600 RepID=A0ABW7YJX8_9ACTN
MAVYRVDQYGRTYYGPNPEVPSFDETTFTAYSVGYEGIYLGWRNPAGDYEGFRLVASMSGYPRTSADGELLMETGVGAPVFHVHADAVPGAFHYYAIFLEINGVWLRAGTASTLHVRDYSMVRWFWERIPIHHRLLQGANLTVDADSNETLLRLISMLGYSMDRLRTSMQAALDATDLRTTHITTVTHRAASLGASVPEGITADQARVITIDSAYLASERGHPSAMRAAARAASGWDVTLRVTPNLLPSYDMAEQLNPSFPEWDASIRYIVGTVVRTDLHLYRCIVAAYGFDQAPPGNGSNNTWWTVHSAVDDRTVAWDSALLTQHGWRGVSHTGGVANALIVPKVGIGVPHPITGDRDANCLTIHNTHSGTADIAAVSLPDNPTGNPLVPIGYGIMLPRVTEWAVDSTYEAERLVAHRGQVWRATRTTTGKRPSTHPSWVRNSTDPRLRLTLSGYTHQAHGTAQAATAVVPYVTWFDEYGKLIGTATASSTADTRVLDTWTTYPGTNALAPLNGRTTEFGGKAWEDIVPGLQRDSHVDGVVRPSSGNTRAVSVINYGAANATLATTLATAPEAGKKQGLVLRLSDASNYLRATRTALEKVVAGVVTQLATYATAAADGDRLTVKVQGNNYTVMINGTQVATATDSHNATATKFGIAVEA